MGLSKLVLTAAGFLHALLWIAPASFADPATMPPPQTITDAAGRTVDLPAKIERVIPAGPPAVALVYALAPEKLAGIIEAWSDMQRGFVPVAYRDLPQLPRLTRPTSDADIAALRSKRADLIVDYGDIGPAYVATAGKG